LSIPEIDLELNSGTLGGRFTTVEGLLRQVHDELSSKVPHESEDQPERRRVFTKFLDKLEQVESRFFIFIMIRCFVLVNIGI
jgi:zinc finger protein